MTLESELRNRQNTETYYTWDRTASPPAERPTNQEPTYSEKLCLYYVESSAESGFGLVHFIPVDYLASEYADMEAIKNSVHAPYVGAE